MARTLVNNGGIWANVKPEVLYYRGGKDESGDDLTGDHAYKMTFPKDALPSRFAKYFWSVIAVDNVHFRVLPNPSNRYLLNEQTHPQFASGRLADALLRNEQARRSSGWKLAPDPEGPEIPPDIPFLRPARRRRERNVLAALLGEAELMHAPGNQPRSG